ncbi:histidinol-phosphatase HisJ family protein [Granulicatella seriolae]|uniref:Histidinol-phosphatase n=1 Tax=Granulicatella seriolae TaxID=2967226 RepID=A0ABT1WP83_9LACT|nr:histidinol-phosphatase HisJ family protein [Granulicatella seriolae]
MKEFFADYHVHTDYSDDSWYLMEDVVKDAIEMGMTEICFTDHVDYGVKDDWQEGEEYLVGKNTLIRNVPYERYFKELRELQEKYQGKIAIKAGLEFGMQVHTIPQFQALYDAYTYDFILLSIHQVDDKEFWTGDYQKVLSHEQSYEGYYSEMYKLVTHYKDYSVLAHMDLMRRYLDKEVDMFPSTKEWIEQILKVVIADGKGIEVNTSSVRYGVKGLTPSIEILKLYHELGGTIITVGSDSHKPEHLGFNIKESLQILKEIGFKQYCSFDKMVPVYHDL